MHLQIFPNTYAVLKQVPGELMPRWNNSEKSFLSITYTEEEVSIVCQERFVPVDFKGEKEKGWRVVKIKGKLDFSMTGILTGLTFPLAEADISIFVLSTFNTDYILIKKEFLSEAISIWKSQGHEITE